MCVTEEAIEKWRLINFRLSNFSVIFLDTLVEWKEYNKLSSEYGLSHKFLDMNNNSFGFRKFCSFNLFDLLALLWLTLATGFDLAISVTRLGEFLQVLGTKLSPKSSPNILVTFWTISKNVTCL